MVTFDPGLWRQRAWDRHKRSGSKAKGSLGQWILDSASIAGLETLVDWCYGRGIKVTFTRCYGGVYDAEDRCITINGRLRPDKQLHFALHECGHHLIGAKDRHERYGMGYSQGRDPQAKRTFHHRCDVVDEELEAWHRGWKLSQRLGIHLSKAAYDQTRVEMLRTYMKWALRLKGYNRDDVVTDEEAVA